MSEFSLHKTEKLCSKSAIEQLFRESKQIKAYPLRVVYRLKPTESGAPAQILISIPKKKIRSAVGRVLMRRRIRECFRLNRSLLYPTLKTSGQQVQMAIIYLSDELKSYQTLENRVKLILQSIADITISQKDDSSNTTNDIS